MTKIIEFVAGIKGDMSVGIIPFDEKVTIIFHGDKHGQSVLDDEPTRTEMTTALAQTIAELVDGFCVSRKIYEEDVIKERIMYAIEEDRRQDEKQEEQEAQKQ